MTIHGAITGWAKQKALEHFNYWEGDIDTVTNDPDDPGGLTRGGVTLRKLQEIGLDVDQDGDVDADDLMGMTAEQRLAVFETFYVDILVDTPLLIELWDFAINAGKVEAVKALQRALNTVQHNSLKVDGVLGPNTRIACSLIIGEEDHELLYRFRLERVAFYNDLVGRRPKLIKFLRGWVRRAINLGGYPEGWR